jgi:hypothetical protein
VLYTIRKLFIHYACATLIDVLHSPFVFELYNDCIKTKSNIKLPNYSPTANDYFNKRCDSIIAKLKLKFATHYFTSVSNDLSTENPFIFYVENEVTIEVIQQKLNSAHNDSLVIVRNIYASAKQTENWQQLKTTQNVTTSIDLFFMGLLFVRKEQRRQAFRLRLL